ncbi:MAG: hypothetical protein ACE5KD_00880 [Candidatus Bathyarchaeia archaeon]
MSEEWVCQNCGYVGNKKEFLEKDESGEITYSLAIRKVHLRKKSR